MMIYQWGQLLKLVSISLSSHQWKNQGKLLKGKEFKNQRDQICKVSLLPLKFASLKSEEHRKNI